MTLNEILCLPFIYPYDSNKKYIKLRDKFICRFYKHYISNDINYCQNNLYYSMLITIMNVCKEDKLEESQHNFKNSISNAKNMPLLKVAPVYNKTTRELYQRYINNHATFFYFNFNENGDDFNIKNFAFEKYMSKYYGDISNSYQEIN